MARLPLGEKSFVAVSEEGVILPGEEVSPAFAANLIAIRGYPGEIAVPGQFLGGETSGKPSPRVVGAISLARLLRDRDLPRPGRITVINMEQSPTLWTMTRRQALVKWGHAPGDEAEDEPSAVEKLDRLARWEDAQTDGPPPANQGLRFTRDGIEPFTPPLPRQGQFSEEAGRWGLRPSL